MRLPGDEGRQQEPGCPQSRQAAACFTVLPPARALRGTARPSPRSAPEQLPAPRRPVPSSPAPCPSPGCCQGARASTGGGAGTRPREINLLPALGPQQPPEDRGVPGPPLPCSGGPCPAPRQGRGMCTRGEGCAGSPECPTAAVAAAGPVSPEPQKIPAVAAAKAGRGRGGGSRGRRRGRRGAGEGEAGEGMGLAARQRRHPAALARPCRRQPQPHSCPPLPSFPLGLGQLQVALPTAPPRCSWHVPAGSSPKVLWSWDVLCPVAVVPHGCTAPRPRSPRPAPSVPPTVHPPKPSLHPPVPPSPPAWGRTCGNAREPRAGLSPATMAARRDHTCPSPVAVCHSPARGAGQPPAPCLPRNDCAQAQHPPAPCHGPGSQGRARRGGTSAPRSSAPGRAPLPTRSWAKSFGTGPRTTSGSRFQLHPDTGAKRRPWRGESGGTLPCRPAAGGTE